MPMFKGEGMSDGPVERYAALGFRKTLDSASTERVRKKPQSYGY